MKKFTQVVSNFHNDERGSNSLEQVVIFAFGVLILGGAYFMWNSMDVGESKGGGLLGLIGDTIGKIFKLDFNGTGKG